MRRTDCICNAAKPGQRASAPSAGSLGDLIGFQSRHLQNVAERLQTDDAAPTARVRRSLFLCKRDGTRRSGCGLIGLTRSFHWHKHGSRCSVSAPEFRPAELSASIYYHVDILVQLYNLSMCCDLKQVFAERRSRFCACPMQAASRDRFDRPGHITHVPGGLGRSGAPK